MPNWRVCNDFARQQEILVQESSMSRTDKKKY